MGIWMARGDSRGCPPWVHFFWVEPQVLARVSDWSKKPMNKGEYSREASFHAWRCHHGLPRVGRPQEQAVWPRATPGSTSENHVLGALFLHDG